MNFNETVDFIIWRKRLDSRSSISPARCPWQAVQIMQSLSLAEAVPMDLALTV
jgi:hypothetical protein